jgi:hypothetical protein
MKPKTYKPSPVAIAILLAGFAVLVFLKLRSTGFAITNWRDVLFYLLLPVAAGFLADLFFARILLDDDRIEIAGLFSRKSYPINDVVRVSTAKGVSVKFELNDGRWITFPAWTGAEAWSAAAALRARLKGNRAAPATAIPSDVTWLTPWHPIDGGAPDDGTVRELRREISARHVLHGVPVRPVARRQDCDDVLFELLDGTGRLAVVHLTYSTRPEPDPRWPETTLFDGWPHFDRDAMQPDHTQWTQLT